MVGSVQGSAQQPFSVLYQPGGTAQESAKSRQSGQQATSSSSTRQSEESRESRNVEKAESRKDDTGAARYAAYDRDADGTVSTSGNDARRGSVLNITV